MTVIRPNSVSGITSITAQANEINFFRSNGTLAGLQLNGVNFNTTTGISTFAALKVTGNLDVEGVLTYQDVTNVDSVGIITARSDISIADKIIHTGDTNTAIRFPAADTVSVETGGSERLRITSSGNLEIRTTTQNAFVGLVTASNAINLTFGGTSGTSPRMYFYGTGNGQSSAGDIFTGAGTGGILHYRSGGLIKFEVNSDNSTTEALRITSGGAVQITGADDQDNFLVKANNTHFAVHQDDTDGEVSLRAQDGSGSNNSKYMTFYTNPSGSAAVERLRIDNDGYLGIQDSDPTVGLSINKFGTQPVTNGNTYPYPAGQWSTVWNTTTGNNTDYWCGFVGGYNVSSATVNISLAPNTFNLNNQQGIYIAGEATSTTTADFTLGKIIGGSQTGASNSAGNQRATKSEMLRVTSEGQLCLRNTGTSSQAANLIVFGNADNADAAIFSGGDWNRGLKLTFSANGGQNDSNVIYNAQGDNGQHFFQTNGTIVGRLEHDQSGFISENVASGDGDTECAAALQNDYSSWAVIYRNDWIGTGSGWGTYWAGNGGARYRRVSSDNNPNEHVMVGSGNKRFTFDLDGGGNAYFDGSLSQNAYDYAEYFEWEDGNPSNEDRRGYSVFVNSNGKIEKATDSTNTAEIIGVISGTAAVVGDAAIYDWQGKWKVDEWGTVVTEVVKQVSWKDDEGKKHSYDLDKVPSGITIPSDASYRQHKRRILNTDYDDSKEYVPRDMRQEWDPVGLLGKVRVRDDSPKNPNWKFIKIVDGKKLWLIR